MPWTASESSTSARSGPQRRPSPSCSAWRMVVAASAATASPSAPDAEGLVDQQAIYRRRSPPRRTGRRRPAPERCPSNRPSRLVSIGEEVLPHFKKRPGPKSRKYPWVDPTSGRPLIFGFCDASDPSIRASRRFACWPSGVAAPAEPRCDPSDENRRHDHGLGREPDTVLSTERLLHSRPDRGGTTRVAAFDFAFNIDHSGSGSSCPSTCGARAGRRPNPGLLLTPTPVRAPHRSGSARVPT